MVTSPPIAEPPVRAPVDPRIQARRVDVHRQHGRRRLRRLVDVVAVLVVATGFAVALRTPLLDVDELRISGAGRTGGAEVAMASGIQPGDQLIDIGVGSAAERVSQLPWVDEAQVQRGVDGVVEIRVTERRPVALAAGPDGRVLVDREGRALAAAGSWPELASGLTVVEEVAPPAALGSFLALDADTAAALTLAEQLAVDVPGTVTHLVVRDGELWGRLAPGAGVPPDATARFGPAAELRVGGLPEVAVGLRTVLDEVDLTCLTVLDLRLPGKPTLTREDECS